MRYPRLAAAAALTGTGAVLAAGYAAAGPAGLIDAASVLTLGILIVARWTLRGPAPRPVPAKEIRRDPRPRPAVRAADFPAYAKIASDLEWAQMSRRDYEYRLRPSLPAGPAGPARPTTSGRPSAAASRVSVGRSRYS